MKQLLAVTLVLIIAGGALAENTFGLWLLDDGEYVNGIAPEEILTVFTLYIGFHDPTVASVGGYELGIGAPSEVIVFGAAGPSGWMNAGDPVNHLVGYGTPLPATGDPFTVLGEILCLGVSIPAGGVAFTFGPGNPSSLPDHDGPVIADGADPFFLVPCGYVAGDPEVFFIWLGVGVEACTLSEIKALFP